jgi:hypothetical protein
MISDPNGGVTLLVAAPARNPVGGGAAARSVELIKQAMTPTTYRFTMEVSYGDW